MRKKKQWNNWIWRMILVKDVSKRPYWKYEFIEWIYDGSRHLLRKIYSGQVNLNLKLFCWIFFVWFRTRVRWRFITWTAKFFLSFIKNCCFCFVFGFIVCWSNLHRWNFFEGDKMQDADFGRSIKVCFVADDLDCFSVPGSDFWLTSPFAISFIKWTTKMSNGTDIVFSALICQPW